MAERLPFEAPSLDASQVGSESTQAAHESSLNVHSTPDDEEVSRTESPDEDADQNLHTEVVQLRRAMQTRPIIDQACGVLMATFGLSPQAAWKALVTTSQNTNTKLHRLASDLVNTAQGDPLPKAAQEQLTAAIAKMNAGRTAEEPTS